MKEQSALMVAMMAGLWCTGLVCADAQAADDGISARIEVLEKELQELKAQQQAQSKADQKQADVSLNAKGMKITSPDKAYEMSLRGYMQLDHRAFVGSDNPSEHSEFLARRLRPVWEARAGAASFRFMPEFAGDAARVFDAYVQYDMNDALAVRMGKFKVPLGLERWQSGSDLMFVERGLPTNLVTNRDFGLMASGNFADDAWEYQAGVFNGNADLSDANGDNDDRKEYVARVFGKPLAGVDAGALSHLALGVAGSYGHQHGSASDALLPNYRSSGQQRIFAYRSGAYVDGIHWRVVPQAHWYVDNVGAMVELAQSHQEVSRGTSAGDVTHTAWQLAGIYVLTGEKLGFSGSVIPEHPVDGTSGDGLGAWGISARVGQMNVDDEAFIAFADPDTSVSHMSSAGVGLTWWLSANLELQTDYNLTRFDGGAIGRADRADEHALFTRAQFRF